VNSAPIVQALADASAEIDGYIEGRFTLPLTDPPAVLNRLTTDIAMYRLQSLRPLHDLEDARKRYEDAIAMLTKVAAGELTLGLSADGKEPPVTAGTVEAVQGPDRVFDRDKLRGY
jgi:phage gp36-like protein